MFQEKCKRWFMAGLAICMMLSFATSANAASDFPNQALTAMNQLRSKKSARKVEFDKELAMFAEQYCLEQIGNTFEDYYRANGKSWYTIMEEHNYPEYATAGAYLKTSDRYTPEKLMDYFANDERTQYTVYSRATHMGISEVYSQADKRYYYMLITVDKGAPIPPKPINGAPRAYDAEVLANVNVRSGPSTAFRRLGRLAKGSVIEVFAANGDWALIEWKGKNAYISKDYIEVAADNPEPLTSITGKLIKKASVYEAASSKARIAAIASKDEIVSIIDVQKIWAYVRLENGTSGYVQHKYLRF